MIGGFHGMPPRCSDRIGLKGPPSCPFRAEVWKIGFEWSDRRMGYKRRWVVFHMYEVKDVGQGFWVGRGKIRDDNGFVASMVIAPNRDIFAK